MAKHPHASEFTVHALLSSPTVTIRDTECQGTCQADGPEEFTSTTQIIFPYRGLYVRHVGHRQIVAEANQALFFNAQEGYRISHPVQGGDGSLTLVIDESQLHELAPVDLLHRSSRIAFRQPRLRIVPASKLWSSCCVSGFTRTLRKLWKLTSWP